MNTLSFRKIRLGWELLLDGKVIANRITPSARAEILLIAHGAIQTFEALGTFLKVDDHLAFAMREKGLYKEKSPLHT